MKLLTISNYSTITLPQKERKNNYIKTSFLVAVMILFLILGYFVIFNDNHGEATIQNEEIGKTNNVDSIPITRIENYGEIERDNTNSEYKSDPQTSSENNVLKKEEKSFGENKVSAIGKKSGFVDIECLPWAKIFIDSVEYDTTPIEKPIALTVGEHKLVLMHPQFPKYEQTLKIMGDQIFSVKVNLDTLYGYLVCKVHPWGDVYVNNNYIGQTPLTSPLKLVPGKYTLQILNPHFKSIGDIIKIQRNDTLSIQYSFTK